MRARALVLAGTLLALTATAGPAAARPGRHDAPVPILMYHVIAAPPPGAPYPKLYVLPADLAAQVRWLAAHGFHAVTLLQVYDYWRRGMPLPARPIVLSFDDGYHSQYSSALPILRKQGWAGVLDLEVANEKPVWGLRPGEVRALLRAGWELADHTLTHPDLTTVGPVRLAREVAYSRGLLRRQFHVPVDFFCYPSGRYDGAVVAEVRAAGFLGATTTNPGLGRPPALYTLDRVRVDGGESAAALGATVEALERAG